MAELEQMEVTIDGGVGEDEVVGGKKSRKKKGLLSRFKRTRKSRKSRNKEAEDVSPEVDPAAEFLEETLSEEEGGVADGEGEDDFFVAGEDAAVAAGSGGDVMEERKYDSSMRESDSDELGYGKSVTRDGNPVISSFNPDLFQPSEVRQDDGPVYPSPHAIKTPASQSTNGGVGSPGMTKSAVRNRTRRGKREMTILEKPPTAREAAYGGPPRYDWIDIETAAAVKVQAAFRRNKVMIELEERGMSTAATRNRARARKSKKNMHAFHSDDVPSVLACCGVGFLFGDATEEDQKILDAQKRQEYVAKKSREEKEETMRRTWKPRRKASDHIVEEFEVVDDDDDEEEDDDQELEGGGGR